MYFLKRTLLIFSILLVAGCSGSSVNNEPPKFSQTSYSFTLDEDTVYTGKVEASDANSDPISFSVASAASNGVFQLSGNGNFTYTPNPDYFGKDSVTVKAADSSAHSTAEITFTIAPVNDAPVLKTTKISVTSTGETRGKIIVEDVDNDPITFALVTPPAVGEISLNLSTGEFVYTAPSLQEIGGTFEISYTDSVIPQPLTAVIQLKGSFTTNLDRLSYYYSSDKSHIKLSQNVIPKITDDLTKDELKIELAKGYVLAGFIDKAEETINAINTADNKAEAYRKSAEVLDEYKNVDLANAYRAKALSSFNAYIAQKGLDNISSDDASFFIDLINDYNDAGQSQAANDLINTLKIYAAAVRGTEHTTAYGRFLATARKNAGALIDIYYETQAESDRLKAVAATDILADLAKKTASQSQPRGTYAGQRVDKVKSLYMAWTAEYYVWLGETEKAKNLTAQTMSLFVEANYDPDNSYPVAPNANVTKNTYAFPLSLIAPQITALYPNISDADNPALALLQSLNQNRYYDSAKEYMFAYKAERALLNGATVADAIAEAKQYYVNANDLGSYAKFLVETATTTPRLARFLLNRKENDKAKKVLDEALTLLSKDAFVLNRRIYISRILGTQGCYRWAKLYKQVATDTASIEAKCQASFDTYFQPGQGKYSEANAAEAYRAMAAMYDVLGKTNKVADIGKAYKAVLEQVSDRDKKLKYASEAAAYLATLKQVALAQDYFDTFMSLSDEVIASNTATSRDYKTLLTYFRNIAFSNNQIKPSYDVYAYLNAIRMQAGVLENYSSFVNKALNDTKVRVKKINQLIAALSVNEQQDLSEDLLKANMYVQLFKESEALAASNIIAPGNVSSIYLLLGELYALKDDFPATWVANVDIDNDGLATFFVREATEQDIQNSGLSLDDDSDNDGIPDAEDPTPIGE